MSALSERARDFWDRISPRERGLVILLGVAAPVVIAIWLGLAIGDGLAKMEAHNDKLRKALVIVADLKARGPQTATDDVAANIPPEPIGLETYLSNAATVAGFTLKGVSPRTPVSRNGFTTSSVSLRVSDVNLDQLKKFLQEIETKSKYVVVTKLEIKHQSFKDKDKLEANLDVSTYARPKAAGEAAGSGAEGSAGAGSGENKGS
jgi:type II secretory pathway component PulM